MIQESVMFIKIVDDTIVEVNIKCGGKCLGLTYIKGKRGCYIYKWTEQKLESHYNENKQRIQKCYKTEKITQK
jgi:hypothetical protein